MFQLCVVLPETRTVVTLELSVSDGTCAVVTEFCVANAPCPEIPAAVLADVTSALLAGLVVPVTTAKSELVAVAACPLIAAAVLADVTSALSAGVPEPPT